ncbi:MAG TPA: hypothetical protein VFL80_11230 [Thermoanaerobaculia bacterium]|nr:hypothetical protein [Thermoanaerobaculia bacterium]
MDSHIRVVGILYIILGCLGALLGVGLFMIIAGAGAVSGDRDAAFITGTVGIVIGVLFIALSLPSIIGGMGLLKMRGWARILVLILSFFNLLGFPIGTAIGAYAIWVLLNDQSKPLFT